MVRKPSLALNAHAGCERDDGRRDAGGLAKKGGHEKPPDSGCRQITDEWLLAGYLGRRLGWLAETELARESRLKNARNDNANYSQ